MAGPSLTDALRGAASGPAPHVQPPNDPADQPNTTIATNPVGSDVPDDVVFPFNAATRVPGLSYYVSLENAVRLNLATTEIAQLGRSGEFVYVHESLPGEHNYVLVQELPPEFLNDQGVPIMENLDVMLANALGEAGGFAKKWVDTNWTSNNSLWGPSAGEIELAINEEKGKPTFLAQPPAKKNAFLFMAFVAKLDALINPKEKLLWAGTPSIIEQLLVAAQLHLKQIHPDWTACPEPPAIIMVIDQLRTAERHARTILMGIMQEQEPALGSTADIDNQLRRCKALATLRTRGYSWEQILLAAECSQLADNVAQIRAAEESQQDQGRQRQGQIGGNTLTVLGGQGALQLQLRREGSNRLSPLEQNQLDDMLIQKQINELTAEHLHLLIKSSCEGLVALEPGMQDISKIDLPAQLGERLNAAFQELYPTHSVRLVPLTALTKLVTLRLGETDNIGIEFFGHLLFKDPNYVSTGRQTIKSSKGIMQVLHAKKHIWQKIYRIEHLDAVCIGLAEAVQHLLHPSIFDHQQILALHSVLRKAHDRWGGKAIVPQLANVLRVRLSEYATALKQAVARNERNPTIPEFDKLGATSADMLAEVQGNARQTCNSNLNAYGIASGETIFGARQKLASGISAQLTTATYQRSARNQDDTRNPGTKLAATQENRAPCVRCDNIACTKRADKCDKRWCKIKKAWTPRTVQIAVEKRRKAGVELIFETDHPLLHL